MVKECRVLSYNKFMNILVFDHEGKQIQTTASLDDECKTVFVKYKDKKYEIISKSEYEKSVRESNKKSKNDISRTENIFDEIPE